ncbi:unnamed protein product [Phytophthora fragariaefolia]|uniref:Unnamed protein product n=1 Tax=Phytophthora fragariaefolia TaxID=1490495 RepID=A0A9W7D2W2_9STRA|nr:unnamed protein product [Phytophthora fragariaefolia]
MFYKKPWWEVVVVEHDGPVSPHYTARNRDDTSGQTTASGSDETNSDGGGSSSSNGGGSSSNRGRSPNNGNDKQNAAPSAANGKNAVQRPRQGHANELNDEQKQDGDWTGGAEASASRSTKAQCLQEVLSMTHQLLVDALECNLVRLEREGQLRGVTVEEICRSCSSVLSFEFFTAQIGLFEMNNISMEVDHPFHAFIDILDPDVRNDLAAEDLGHSGGQTNATPRLQPQLSAEDQLLISSVRRVLQWEEERLQVLQTQERLERNGGNFDSEFDPVMPLGYPSVDGTALFPIICTMNHSCDPNCTVMYTKNGDGHVVAIRDIQKGEELCICYIDIDMDVRIREANLREYKFKCFCPRCVQERQRQRPEQRSSSNSAKRTSSAAPQMGGPFAGDGQPRRPAQSQPSKKSKNKNSKQGQGR